MSKKTVFLAIPNHISGSDLLRTHYLEYLTSKYKVVVITPFLNSDDVVQQKHFSSQDVEYKKRVLENPRFWSFFKFLRICWVNEFDYITSIRYWYQRPNYKNSSARRLVRFMGRPFYKILTADFFTKVEYRLLPKSKNFAELVKQHNPVLVITATPGFDSWEAEIICLSRYENVPTVAVDFSWDNLTTNSKHIRKTDYLVAWNNIMKAEASKIHHYASDRVFVSGTPRFDPYFDVSQPEPSREEFLLSKDLNPKYKTIFHTTVTKAYSFQKKYIHDLIKLRKEGDIPYVNLFIRIHPLDIYDNYKEFLNVPDLCIESSGKYFGKSVEMNYQDLLNLKYSLKYTDLNINYASTISIEACIFDKPIINIGFLDRFKLAYEFNHYAPIYKSGAIRLAKTDKDLKDLINLYLTDPTVDKVNREKIASEYVIFFDGLSYKRSVDILEQIINHNL
ncbi:MAG: hypothetical protein Q8Q90_01505 [bacterium]|nr:hypothetical protein [bacterium]